MNIQNITTKLTQAFFRTSLKVKKSSPEILLITGLVLGAGSIVLACFETLKANEVVEQHEENLEKIDDAWTKVKDGEISLDAYSERDRKRDLTITYAKTAVGFAKLYGPSITLALISATCFVYGHGIMKKRNVALMAAYKTLEEGFNAYRKRVKDEFGDDKDYFFKNGLKSEQITETTTDAEGKTHKEKKTVVNKVDKNSPSIYARFFDESCQQWSKDPEYNLLFLKTQEEYFNNLLHIHGHVFLNEVYDALGIQRTQAGAVVGWVLRNDGEGDNQIDFGIFDKNKERSRAFVNGLERSFLVDPNVDGVIYDKI